MAPRPPKVGISGLAHAALWRGVPAAAILALILVSGVFGLGYARAQVEREVYRDRLAEMTGRYDNLITRYNQAVRRTALTELIVGDDRSLAVGVRTAAGDVERIPTPYNAAREIYVDYAIIEGRVWIRRVFDDATPPSEATLIDPELAQIEWDALSERSLGQAVYRSLEPGRWVIDVTGSGALGLRRADANERITLGEAPEIRRFEAIEREARAAAESVTWFDALRRILGI